MRGNVLEKPLNVFDKGGEGKGTSETFQWRPKHFAWEILWHYLLGTLVQRWCSPLCSLTRLDVSSFLAASQCLVEDMSQEKCWKFLWVAALLVKDLAQVEISFSIKKRVKKTKAIHSSESLSVQRIDCSLLWLGALSDNSWARRRVESVCQWRYRKLQASVFCRWSRVKKSMFCF